MGDAADDLRDREESAYDAHLFGECGEYGECIYCWVEERQRQRRIDEMECYDYE